MDSTRRKKDVSGWCYYLGTLDKNGFRQGNGKSLLSNGNSFIGKYNGDLMTEGDLYEI